MPSPKIMVFIMSETKNECRCAASCSVHDPGICTTWSYLNCEITLFSEMRINAWMLDRYWCLFVSHILFLFFINNLLVRSCLWHPRNWRANVRLGFATCSVWLSSTNTSNPDSSKTSDSFYYSFIEQTAHRAAPFSMLLQKKEEKKCTTAHCGALAFMCVWIIE